MNRTSQSAEGFFRRSMRASIAMGALVMLFASIYAGPSAPTVALIYAASLVWMLLNFLLWRFGIREMLGAKRLVFLIPLVAAKFGWLVFLYFL